MAKLVWNQDGQNRYEFGVDRGVLYPQEDLNTYSKGVVWNGLLTVEEALSGGELSSYHFDGTKYLDTVNPKTYQATISAYSAPPELKTSLGERAIIPGFILTRQARARFGFSYRTFVGTDKGYKIHLIYNATAQQTSISNSTMEKEPDIGTASWKIEAVPYSIPNYRSSSHYLLDSSKVDPGVLLTLEAILYGSDDDVPRLPTIEELISLVYKWEPLTIVPQEGSGLAGLIYGIVDLYRTTSDGLNRALPDTRLIDTEVEGIYEMEEEE